MLTRYWQKILNRVFEWLQKRCPHDSGYVRADMANGMFEPYGWQIKWCLRCGAVRIASTHSLGWNWNEPRATWSEDYKRSGEDKYGCHEEIRDAK